MIFKAEVEKKNLYPYSDCNTLTMPISREASAIIHLNQEINFWKYSYDGEIIKSGQ